MITFIKIQRIKITFASKTVPLFLVSREEASYRLCLSMILNRYLLEQGEQDFPIHLSSKHKVFFTLT